MQKKLLHYICCPDCKSDLYLANGSLKCKKCTNKYKIEEDIPIFINLRNPPCYLTHQISYFEKEDKTRPTYALDEWQKSYLRRFFENIEVNIESIILDIACGSGYMAVEIARKGVMIIACDLTINQLFKLKDAIKRYKLQSSLFLVCCSAESLPFKNNIADVIIENAILEHLPKEKEAIAEIDRVAKKKAQLMISTPLSYWYIWPFLILVNIWHDKKIGHLRRYTRSSLVKKILGFRLKRIYYTGHLIKFLFFFFSLFFKTKKLDYIAEKIDKKFERLSYGGTVITAFFRR